MSKQTVQVTIGRMAFHVPMVTDEATTQRVAERVNDRLEAYQMQGGKIDDLAFALRAAFDFAADLESVTRRRAQEVLQLKQEMEQDSEEVVQALDGLLQALREILSGAGDARE